MIAPVVSSITFDKSAYNTGDLITATVNYNPGKSDQTQAFTGVATDSTTGLSGQLSVSFVVSNAVTDATALTISDDGGRTWTPISDNGTVAVFTANA